MAEHDIFRRRRGRNYLVGGLLLLFALLIFAVTIVKLKTGTGSWGPGL
ncbi:hypothetical protein [Neomegalonema perideroedes]|nr:hypothetical protein [Neomegalonema perideroedes]